ncbi:Mss4-like protein [Irpex rosettiformis]|uniref:Mss4-like protein n=1 Tax=Irpex rosettiformis TaxID=378272 RepID=A0ACB8UEA9_9APHY|nr:Mss4-like protein [Irpex rosettiformis]
MSTDNQTTTFEARPLQTGSCLCGQIAYEITLSGAPPKFITLCHCINCKKWGGGGFSWNGFISCDQIRFTKGEEHLKAYADSNTGSGRTILRRFCSNCGSPIIATILGRTDICGITVGTVDGDVSETWKPQLEVMCKDRPVWLPDTGLKQYETTPEEYKKN